MKLTLRIWRQPDRHQPGSYERHALENVSADLSLLEALDQLNEQLISAGQRPIGFDHDCREGICGSCGFLVNGQAHGPRGATSVCQLYLREFRDGAELTLEPWRARAFPLIQDMMVDRSAFDRLIGAGGYCSSRAPPSWCSTSRASSQRGRATTRSARPTPCASSTRARPGRSRRWRRGRR